MEVSPALRFRTVAAQDGQEVAPEMGEPLRGDHLVAPDGGSGVARARPWCGRARLQGATYARGTQLSGLRRPSLPPDNRFKRTRRACAACRKVVAASRGAASGSLVEAAPLDTPRAFPTGSRPNGNS